MSYTLFKNCLFICSLGTMIFASEEPIDEAKLREELKSYSQERGYQFAEELKDESILFDLEAAIEGVKQYSRGELLKEVASGTRHEKDLRVYEKQLFEAEAQKNLEQAERSLHMLSQKKTVHILEEGAILYEILEPGHGTQVLTDRDTVVAPYTIFYNEGKVFISSQDGKDISLSTFSIDDLLPSLSRAMVGMLLGEKRKIYVHPNLAYGKIGHLPPNSLLIMEVKLLEIVKNT